MGGNPDLWDVIKKMHDESKVKLQEAEDKLTKAKTLVKRKVKAEVKLAEKRKVLLCKVFNAYAVITNNKDIQDRRSKIHQQQQTPKPKSTETETNPSAPPEPDSEQKLPPVPSAPRLYPQLPVVDPPPPHMGHSVVYRHHS